MRMDTPTKSVKIPETEYKILLKHSEKTGKRMQALLAKAIIRCYGVSPDSRKEPRA